MADERKTVPIETDDPYLWLENVTGEESLAWVRAHNDDYLAKKASLRALVHQHADETVASSALDAHAPDVVVNGADGDEPGSVYITVTGTSAEAGDDGQVGRGNRMNGLITPYRPMTMEAAAGKNPVAHVGKLYNAVAQTLAARLVTKLEDVEEACCWLVSRIGQPVDRPQAVDVRVRMRAGASLPEARIAAIVEAELARLTEFSRGWLAGMHEVA